MNRPFVTSILLLGFSAVLCAQSQNQATRSASQDPQSQNVQSGVPAGQKTSTLQTIYLPSGLDIQIRVNETLSSATARQGDTFTGTLVNSIDDDNNNIIFERGAQVSGTVVSAKPSGRLQDSGQLVLSINTIRSDQYVANLKVISKEINGASHAGSNATKAGGGALLGAIIGGLAGGGKGAVIGAAGGAAAGTGAAAATGRKEAKVTSESMVHFVTSTETTVVAANSPAAQEIEREASVYSPGPQDDNAPVLQRRRDTNNNNYPQDSTGNSNNYPPNNGGDSSNYPQSTSQRGNYPQDNYPQSGQNSPRPTTTVARNRNENEAPVLRRREGSDSDTTNSSSNVPSPANAPDSSTVGNAASAPNNGNTPTVSSTPTAPTTQWGFSARDKRVISSCLADNPGSVPAADANAIPYYRGDTLPYAAQKKIRALPLACERQLPAVSTDQERIIYNQQVLLINNNSLVLDSFDLPKQ